jgi:hypothetical protein
MGMGGANARFGRSLIAALAIPRKLSSISISNAAEAGPDAIVRAHLKGVWRQAPSCHIATIPLRLLRAPTNPYAFLMIPD